MNTQASHSEWGRGDTKPLEEHVIPTLWDCGVETCHMLLCAPQTTPIAFRSNGSATSVGGICFFDAAVRPIALRPEADIGFAQRNGDARRGGRPGMGRGVTHLARWG